MEQSPTQHKSPFIKVFDPSLKVLKLFKKLDFGTGIFFPGEAFIPTELGMDPYRLKLLWEQRYFVAFDEGEDTTALLEVFHKKVRMIKAALKVETEKRSVS